ncbi:MAG: type II toxin-antitoxin system MqsA family antitoxin [Geovibrio sp.]|nr:type II toxin-antitoxin system MqsA family antitoxin [Geovibrio sp.]
MQVVPGVKAKILSSVNDIATGKPKGNEVWILSKETAKLHYTQKLSLAEYVTNSGRYTGCPHCGEPVSLDDAKEEPFCKGKIKVSSGKHRTCGTTFYAPANYRRYAIAKFLNKKKVKLDLAIFDEVHELKGG